MQPGERYQFCSQTSGYMDTRLEYAREDYPQELEHEIELSDVQAEGE